MNSFFKDSAESNGWVYEYGRTDYQNLFDTFSSAATVHLFVDPITTDSTFSDTGFETKTYSGKFMMLRSSDVDETYEDKYTDYIKPLIDGALQTLKDEIICAEYDINKFATTEIINLFDFNLDGVLVNYSFRLNE
jgi:hypothetical protein